MIRRIVKYISFVTSIYLVILTTMILLTLNVLKRYPNILIIEGVISIIIVNYILRKREYYT